MKDILIVGKSGLLGTKTQEELIDEHRVGGVSLSGVGKNNLKLDITDEKDVKDFVNNHSFDVVIHTAAITDVDFCEQKPDDAWETNVRGTENLVFSLKNTDTKLIYISSDYIFSGESPPYDKNSNPDPVNYYGLTKLEAERIIREELRDYAIIRPGKLYGYTEENGCDPFVEYVRETMSGTTLDENVIFDDHIIKYPTLIDDVVRLIETIISEDRIGMYHISGDNPVTKYEWAVEIANQFGLRTEKLAPGQSESKAKRPRNVEYTLQKLQDLNLPTCGVKEGLDVMYKQEFCTFRPIYRQDLADRFEGSSSAELRQQLGRQLARTDNVSADMAIPVPESGVYPATGYANEAEVPLKFGISKHNFRRQTLYDQTIDRKDILDDRMSVIPEVISEKNIVIVDEAILSGTTIQSIVPKLKEASSVHLRISSPPIVKDCPVDVHPDDITLFSKQFAARSGKNLSQMQESIANELGVDSIRFIPIETYTDIISENRNVCSECFFGDSTLNKS